jgi:pimeloyl-ACP methyl ester carboxylesterase
MDATARLLPTYLPRTPEAAVLVLHGGASRTADVRVSPTQLSVLRMIPIARRIARVGRRRLAVFRLLNSVRGWDTKHTPVDDARWALREIEERLGATLPFGLVGHSLGGRAAILAAGEPDVHSVVALAPWMYPDDGLVDASGRRVLIVHGSADRIASPRRSEAAAKLLRRTAQVGYIRVDGGKHAMLQHHGVFDRLAADFTAATLLGESPKDPNGPLGRVLAGEAFVDA